MKDSLNKPADYWYWLARPEVEAEIACPLIANIEPRTLSDQNLKSHQKNLLMTARTLVSESGIEKLPALEWLRWAVEHEELLIGYGAEKEQLQKILRAVDRNSGQQQKAELEILRQQLKQERDAPQEKPLHPSERRSTSQIIATLAAMAGLDLSTPYTADETLRASAATHGLELPSSPETVVKFLKDATARAGKS